VARGAAEEARFSRAMKGRAWLLVSSRETDEALDFVSERFRLLSENRSCDMIYQDKLKACLRVLLLRLKIDCDHIGEVDIRAVGSIFRLDKTYSLHGKSPSPFRNYSTTR
jgi:hypothetical protein